MSFSSEPRVTVHRDRVKLLQTGERVEKHDDHASTFNRLHGSAKHIGRNRLEVLENAHSEGLAQDLVSILVKRIADVFACHEEFNLIHFVFIELAL